jgi:hypothetical protein
LVERGLFDDAVVHVVLLLTHLAENRFSWRRKSLALLAAAFVFIETIARLDFCQWPGNWA